MRRWLSSLLVALLLLVQQEGLLHGLAHAMAAAQAHATAFNPPAAEPADLPCGECLGLAQMASAHTLTQSQPVLLAGLAHARPVHTARAGLAADTPAARSRDPPPRA